MGYQIDTKKILKSLSSPTDSVGVYVRLATKANMYEVNVLKLDWRSSTYTVLEKSDNTDENTASEVITSAANSGQEVKSGYIERDGKNIILKDKVDVTLEPTVTGGHWKEWKTSGNSQWTEFYFFVGKENTMSPDAYNELKWFDRETPEHLAGLLLWCAHFFEIKETP